MDPSYSTGSVPRRARDWPESIGMNLVDRPRHSSGARRRPFRAWRTVTTGERGRKEEPLAAYVEVTSEFFR